MKLCRSDVIYLFAKLPNWAITFTCDESVKNWCLCQTSYFDCCLKLFIVKHYRDVAHKKCLWRVRTPASDQFAHPVGLKKNFYDSHTSCVEHEESSGTKQRLRKYTTHSEPLIELSNQRKHKEHVYFYFNFKLIGSKK